MEQELLSVTSGGLFKNGITRSDFPVSDESLPEKQVAVILKTFAFLSLLSQGHDLITPVILNADEQRYVDADEELRRKMEERARKVLVPQGLTLARAENTTRQQDVMVALCLTQGVGTGVPTLSRGESRFVWVKECLVNAEAGKFADSHGFHVKNHQMNPTSYSSKRSVSGQTSRSICVLRY